MQARYDAEVCTLAPLVNEQNTLDADEKKAHAETVLAAFNQAVTEKVKDLRDRFCTKMDEVTPAVLNERLVALTAESKQHLKNKSVKQEAHKAIISIASFLRTFAKLKQSVLRRRSVRIRNGRASRRRIRRRSTM